MRPERAVHVDGDGHITQPVLREHDDGGARGFVEPDEIERDGRDIAEVSIDRRIRDPTPLQVVVEVRQVDQRQRRVVFLVDPPGRVRNPLRRPDGRPRAPELEERERAERGLQVVPESGR